MFAAILYGLSAAALWGTGDFASRVPSQRVGYYLTSSLVQLFGFIGLLIYLTATSTLEPILLLTHPTLIVVNSLVGVSMFVALLFLYRGYATGIMSVTAPIAGSYPIVTLGLSALLLGEAVGGLKLVGIGTVIAGIILAGVKLSELRFIFSPKESQQRRNGLTTSEPDQKNLVSAGNVEVEHRAVKGFDSGLVACISLGLTYFGLAIVAPIFGQLVPIMIMRGAAAVTAFALFFPLKQKFAWPNTTTFLWIILLSVLDTAGFIAIESGLVLAGSNLPIVVTFSGLVGVFTITLAGIFYHERLEPIQYIGICIIFIGAATVLYF